MKNFVLFIVLLSNIVYAQVAEATFGGGCFWCMEAAFQPIKGVLHAESGYMGGNKNDANYKEVSTGKSAHYEVVRVQYDTKIISYQELLEIFWKNIDPIDAKGQFYDKGEQYKTVIFYKNEQEKVMALRSREALDKSGRFSKKIVTEIKPAKVFYKAEAYHQDYFIKNSLHYKMYKKASGREEYLKKVWK